MLTVVHVCWLLIVRLSRFPYFSGFVFDDEETDGFFKNTSVGFSLNAGAYSKYIPSFCDGCRGSGKGFKRQ